VYSHPDRPAAVAGSEPVDGRAKPYPVFVVTVGACNNYRLVPVLRANVFQVRRRCAAVGSLSAPGQAIRTA
jgi:hypothetical protein